MKYFSNDPLLSFFETKKVQPICKSLLCIFNNSEAYINLGKSRLIVFVASSKGKFICDESSIRAFLIKPGQSVEISKGIWHFSPFPIDEDNEFLVMLGKKNVILGKNGEISLNPGEVIETNLENEYMVNINDLRF